MRIEKCPVSEMLRRTKIALGISIIVIVVIVLSNLMVSSATENFLFSKSLNVGEFESHFYNSSNDLRNEYVANLTDENTLIRTVFLRIWSLPSNLTNIPRCWILLQLAYKPDTEVDSITLRVDSGSLFSKYYTSSLGTITSTNFYEDGSAIVYEIKELGNFLGQGTVTLEFLIEDTSQLSSVAITADISMHQTTPIQLTSLNAHVFLDAAIPSDNL